MGKRKKHGTVTVRNPETQQTVESTFSPKGEMRAVRNLVTQITKLFSGRGRRGQGEFKLSLDGSQKEEWFGVLKRSGKGGMSTVAKKAVDKVMAGGTPNSINEIYDKVYNHITEKTTVRGLSSIPSKREIIQYLRGNKKYNNVEGKWSLVGEDA